MDWWFNFLKYIQGTTNDSSFLHISKIQLMNPQATKNTPPTYGNNYNIAIFMIKISKYELQSIIWSLFTMFTNLIVFATTILMSKVQFISYPPSLKHKGGD